MSEQMKIPFEFKRDNKYYIFVKQCNRNLFQYDVYDLNRNALNYTETFQAFDLGLVRQKVIRPNLRKNMNMKP